MGEGDDKQAYGDDGVGPCQHGNGGRLLDMCRSGTDPGGPGEGMWNLLEEGWLFLLGNPFCPWEIEPPLSFNSPSSSARPCSTTPTPTMPTSVESSSVELSTDHAPLARPRPRYFDPHRYSGSASSSHASTSELHPPSSVSFVWTPRGSAGSSYSLSASETPFVGLNRPLSLGYEYTLPADVSSWGVDLDPHVKEADDEMHDPEYDFVDIPPPSADTPSRFDRWSVPSLRPFLHKFRRGGASAEDEKAESGRSTPVEPEATVTEKTLEAGAGALEPRTYRLHRRFRAERDNNFRNWRALVNLGALILLLVVIITFFVGYPVLTHFLTKPISTLGAFNLGGTNATGQVPDLPVRFTLIDPDTPRDAYTIASTHDSSTELELVFSDEFNIPGRTFYPGDDPYWEAVDLHYWPTNNLEWYDPAAVITADDGTLTITLQQKDTHDLQYQGGMIQTWNKLCFTGGYVVANVSLPGVSNVQGLWPALWMMGNLGRAGYGATTDGLWPYSYDSCDVGTVKNQSVNGVPAAASINGDQGNGGVLSFLPGQRLSRCTCEDAPDGSKGTRLDHPGPKHNDGTWVGRAAPEIDVFEAQVGKASPDHLGILTGQVSQSAQWAPFDAGYMWQNATYGTINNPETSVLNTFTGSVTQQSTSVVTDTNPQCYEYPTQGLIPPPMAGETEDPNAQTIYGQNTGCYSIYGVEYKPGFDDAYIQWVSSGQPSWSMLVQGVGANEQTEIGPRAVPQEPMYLIANLGMSHNFGAIDLAHIPFPVHMKIDWVRVYQPSDAKNIGCDPKDFPTANYIERYIEAYTNPNLTTWVGDFGQTIPGNSFLGECSS